MNDLKSINNIYSQKNVLIFGLGTNQGGVGSAKYFHKSCSNVRITDLKEPSLLQSSLTQLKEYKDIEYTLGEHKYSDIDWADLIIKNPAIKPDNKYLEYAKKKNKKIETDMGIFLNHISVNQIIGITGTKGKSTTSKIIYEILKESDKKVLLAGNIGTSVLDIIPDIEEDTLVVLELSSFQLEAYDKHQVSPKYALITNITPDHLDYYKNMENYITAKKAIALNQNKNDYLFLNKHDENTNSSIFLKDIKSNIVLFSEEDLPRDFKSKLRGKHNRENIAAALSVAKILKLDINRVLKIVANIESVEFRIQLVKEVEGIKIYNDSASTNPISTIDALKEFPNSIVIIGGMNKNLNYQELALEIDKSAKDIYLIEGTATEELKKFIKQKSKVRGEYNDLRRLITDIKSVAKSGDIILFSPGATSFNLFQNEFDRGNQFNEIINKMFK